MIKLGEKIKSLRKQKNISQEVFANYLGVSFQAVSKWENGYTMPDVTMIPAIASFFGVSTDELFDFNLFETEKQVEEICREAYKYRFDDPERSERILREGLQRFPGNDIILNNLLYTMDYKTRADEVISLCKTLIESTKQDDVKYDACRILAEGYSQREPSSHGFERQISAPAADKMLAISYIASHFLFASAKYLLAQNCAAPSGVEFFDGFCQSESKQDTHLAR